ncbi:MAG: hypothetical protein GX758_04310, partial [Tenericutes bacterium]|nr:hypothetical protein [Mycoplasmatota bacterium]
IASFSLDDVELNKKYAILCYIGFLFLYPMTKKEIRSSSYMLFHINQGINLFIFDIIVFVICGILNSMFTKVYAYSSSTPILVSFICYMLYCLAIILSLYGVINTFNGKSRELPVIFNFNLIK